MKPVPTPFALRDAPALIETVFPAQKVSFEAQKERKAGAGQTLTALGSYWKGRKPLILVRAVVLGSLLPPTGDAERDLEIFEKLMAFDDEGLARRALAASAFSAARLHEMIWGSAARNSHESAEDLACSSRHSGESRNPEQSKDWTPAFAGETGSAASGRMADKEASGNSLGAPERWFTFPSPSGRGTRGEGQTRWRRDVTMDDKLVLYRQALATITSYEAKASLCKRPEEVDQAWLYAPVWPEINDCYAHLGVKAHSFPELIEQLGILRYGHRPRVGDTFCGGGSIPFEAARLGCDVVASDLNPIACMLTWGALNIIGASPERRAGIEKAQREVAEAVDQEITALGIEHDEQGNRAKAYLYCLETRCPETGWMIPMAPSWVISKTRKVIARLMPDHRNQRFDIEILSGVSDADMKAAENGTVQDGDLVYELDGRTRRTPVKTLRGDYRLPDGTTGNRLRRWEKSDFKPRPDDIFQERLYCVYLMHRETLERWRPATYFASVTKADLECEAKVEAIVAGNLARWQDEGLVPDMAIEPGDETTRLFRERGWTHWHHLFNARDILYLATYKNHAKGNAVAYLYLAEFLNYFSRLCAVKPGGAGSRPEEIWIGGVFANQALNTFFNYSSRAFSFAPNKFPKRSYDFSIVKKVQCAAADKIAEVSDVFITDPPYADAINYHEITEFFIAWLRKNPPKPFDEWVWDSRRALAIKGSGEDFRRGMVAAYRAMAEHMPDNGLQCVMFTHQSTSVWSDMVGIFWGAGLQVVAAWYIATETTSELKKGGYVQGTVILILKKRAAGERQGFKQRILPAVRTEVQRQIETMLHLNDEVKSKHGEPVFNDSDLQMAGYAAALKVLTAYTQIGGEDVTTFALRPRVRGKPAPAEAGVTVVDEIVQQAAEAANSLLVPEGLKPETWAGLSGMERFMFRMMDMETTGSRKLDNYQNFAKAFRVQDYTRVMGNMTANQARLKRVREFASRDLTDSTELGATRLGRLIIGIQQLLSETEPQTIIGQLQAEMPDFLEVRPLLVDMLAFLSRKAPEPEAREAAEVLGARLRNLRFGA